MGRDREVEKEFIRQLAGRVKNEAFIISSLRLMDTDELRKKMIEYIISKPNAGQKEIESKMFYLSIQ